MPARDRARGDHHDVLAAGVQLGDLRADAVEDVGPERALVSGDDRGAEFGDHGHGAASVGTHMPRSRAYARHMTELRTVRVAAVQATPVILDAAGIREEGGAI